MAKPSKKSVRTSAGKPQHASSAEPNHIVQQSDISSPSVSGAGSAATVATANTPSASTTSSRPSADRADLAQSKPSRRWSFVGALLLLLLAALFGWFSYPQHPLYQGNITEIGGGYDFFHSYCIVKALNAKIANVYSSQELLDFSRALSNGKNWAINDNHLLPFYILYQPLANRDFSSAYYIHLWANLNLFWLAAFVLTLSILPNRKQAYAVMALVMIATVTIGPAVDNIWLGQIGFAFSGILALTFLLDRANFQKAAGICLALAILLKMYPALLLLYFGRKRRWQLLLWVLYTLVALSLVAGLQWGFAHYANYLSFLAHSMSYNASLANQSFIGVVANACPYLAPDELKLVHLAFLALVAGGLLWFTWSMPLRFANISWGLLEYSLWVCLATVASPLSWGHHHVLLLLPWLAFLGLTLGTEYASSSSASESPDKSVTAPPAPAVPERYTWSAPCLASKTVRMLAWAGMAAIVTLWCCEGETATNAAVKGFHYAFCQSHGGLVGLAVISGLIAACLVQRQKKVAP